LFRRVLFVILLVSLLLTGGQVAGAGDSSVDRVLLLKEIMDRLNHYHLEKPGPDGLTNGAIEGMLETLDDPYTEYFSPSELEEFANTLDNDLFGIGVELQPGDSYPVVVRVITSSPAEKAGVQAGDLIMEVDGVSLKEMDLVEVVSIIRGPEGSEINLTVERQNKGQLKLTVVRGHINMPTVDFQVVNHQTGYIRISSFGAETPEEFDKALNSLLDKNIKSLVLDLRNNGGGYLQAAVELVSRFLPPGSKVVSIVNRDEETESHVTSGQPVASAISVAILVNEHSASATEVMAAALRDYGRAVLVGTQTYGKGVMQTVIPLSNGGALKVTTHRYYTPSGSDINGTGLIPDRQVIVPQLQIAAALQIFNPEPAKLEYFLKENIIKVDNREIEYWLKPFTVEDTIYIPLRFSLEALGYEVFPGEECITITGFGDTLEVYPASGKVLLNKEQKDLPKPVQKKNGLNYIDINVLELLKLEITKGQDRLRITSSQ
jgi:carboxyl-terminal processing protease